MKKSIINAAVVAALGMAAGTAGAATVTSFTLKDVGSNSLNGIGNYSATLDGKSGAFIFSTSYVNVKTYLNASPFNGDVSNGSFTAPGAVATGSFSTGFLFSGTPFVPFLYGNGMQADITGGAMTVTNMQFGGNYGGVAEFLLPPDSGFPLQVLWTVGTNNATDFNVAFRWGHLITTSEDPSGMYVGFTAQWALEGCASTIGNTGTTCGATVVPTGTTVIPVPAAAWLLGSGLLGMVGVARRRKSRQG